MTTQPGYTDDMKRALRVIVIVTLLLAATSCLITPPSPTADGTDAPSGATDGTTVDGDPESTDDIGPSTPDVVALLEGTPSSRDTTPGDVSPKPDEIPLRILAAGNQSAVRVPVAGAITSQVVLEEVWFAMHANQLGRPAVPKVDFESETVIILILGERPSAGYSVRAAEITLRDDNVEVRIAVSSPGPDVMTASVLTSPFQLSAIEITDVPVIFVGDDVRDGYDDGW